MLSHALHVDISCRIGKTDAELECGGYTVTNEKMDRTVVFDVPGLASNLTVTYIDLTHPALEHFLVEIFAVFPNLQKIFVRCAGSCGVPSFRNATKLIDFEVDSVVANGINSNWYSATKLQRFAYFSITDVDPYAFVGLTNLITLELSMSFSRCAMPDIAFYPLVNLKYIFLWNMHVVTIPATMFSKNTKLENIVISDSLSYLEAVESTFIDHLPNIKSIYIAGGCVDVIKWALPQPISEFHTAMAQCYANYKK